VGASLNCKKTITQKINALSKNILFKTRYSRIPCHMHLRINTQPGSITVEKMAGIFTKRIWQLQPHTARGLDNGHSCSKTYYLRKCKLLKP